MDAERLQQVNRNLANIQDWRMNQSAEGLIGKFLEYENLISRFEDEADPRRKQIVIFCRDKLEEARVAIFPVKWYRPWHRKTFLAWRLLHRVAEELILLMDCQELQAYGPRLAQEVRMAPVPKEAAGAAVARIDSLLEKLGNPAPTAADIKLTACHYRNILKMVNDAVDDRFWNIWVQKLLALCYALLLIVAGYFLFFGSQLDGILALAGTPCPEAITPDREKNVVCSIAILLAGAVGGLLSGILTGERESIPKSHFLVPISYYLLARPLIGAAAALAVFWAVESEFLLRIQVASPTAREANHNTSPTGTAVSGQNEKTANGPEQVAPRTEKDQTDSAAQKQAAPALPAVAEQKVEGNGTEAAATEASVNGETQQTAADSEGSGATVSTGLADETNAKTNNQANNDDKTQQVLSVSMVTLRVPSEEKKKYLYLLLLVFAGFSGDKVLKQVADKVTARLISQAEKTAESK